MRVFLSWGCRNKFPQTGWLETVEVYSLSSRSRKSKIQVPAGLLSLGSSERRTFQLLGAPSVPGGVSPVPACVHMVFPSSCVGLGPSLMENHLVFLIL